MATKKTIQVVGRAQVAGLLGNLTKKIENDLKKVLFIAALKIEKDAKILVNQGPHRTGDLYKRAGVTRIRSAPGEPAKTDRGRLVADIRTEVVAGSNGLAYEVGTRTVDYAPLLEFGTSRMRARPWLFPTARKNFRTIESKVGKALNVRIKKEVKK